MFKIGLETKCHIFQYLIIQCRQWKGKRNKDSCAHTEQK